MTVKRSFFVIVGALAFAPAADANITINGTLSATDPSLTVARVFRDGIASTCASAKAFPGTVPGSPFQYDAYTVHNSGPSRFVTVNVDVGTCGTNVFTTAYSGSFNPANLATNYVADQGSSATQPFSFVASANGTYVLMVSATQTGTAGMP